MASKTLAPVADHQQQDEQSIEETNKSMIRSLLVSGVRNLAIFDESLTQQEERKLVSATKVTPGETVDPVAEIGQEFCGLADKIDGILDKKAIINDSRDQDKEIFMKIVGEIVKKEKTKGVVMTVVMVAYAFIRNYLKHCINEDILNFIESVAKWLYQVFVKLGVIDWILSIGGWEKLKSMTSYKKSHWAIFGIVGLVITGVSAYNFYYV